MKKLMLMLMVLAMAAPLYAAGEVTFVATDNEDGTCTITFDANDIFDIQPVAMGVDVKVNGSDASHDITAVDGIDSFFDIFMDAAYSIQSDPCDPCYPYDYGEGTPIADPCGPGEIALPSKNFTVSMGGLGGESGELASAPDNGTAFILTAGDLLDDTLTGHIKVNARRGGVIGNDTEPMVTNLHLDFTITHSTPTECMAATHTDYSDWKNLSGMIDCWCYCKQCNGDTSGNSAFGGAVAVFSDDLPAILPPNYGSTAVTTTPGHPGWCGDTDHKGAFGGAVRVFTTDLARFLPPNYGNPSLPPCSGPGCDGPNPGVGTNGCDPNPLPNSEFNFWLYTGDSTQTPCP